MSIQLFSNLLFSLSESVKNICHILQFKLIFRQVVTAVCVVSLLFSSPAVALAGQNNDPGIVNINDESTTVVTIINHPKKQSNDTRLAAGAVGAVAGSVVGSLGAVGLVSATGTVAGLSASGIVSGLAALGGIFGGGMVFGIAAAAALPIAGVVGSVLIVKAVGDVFASNSEEIEQPIASK
jgi:hypothetical protein